MNALTRSPSIDSTKKITRRTFFWPAAGGILHPSRRLTRLGGVILWCCLFAGPGLYAQDDGIDSGLAVYRSHSMEKESRVYEGETYWWNGQPVQDKDALNGMAQMATPEKHKDAHQYVFCTGHETKIRSGRYTLVYRLKISVKPEKALPVCDILAYSRALDGQMLFRKRGTRPFPKSASILRWRRPPGKWCTTLLTCGVMA